MQWKELPLGTDAQVLYCHTPEHLGRLKEILQRVETLDWFPAKADVDTRMYGGYVESRDARRGRGLPGGG